MPVISNRVPFSQKPFRTKRVADNNIIFLSMEGSVTEEEYFSMISEIYNGIRTKIQFISVMEEIINTPPKRRTPEQTGILGKNRPLQLVNKIERFKAEKEEDYQFSKYSDEFWIVTDVDDNWSDMEIRPGKTRADEWKEAVGICEEKGYGYAVSNPFFEIWLLLHHDEPTEEDRAFAVTDEHVYEKTDHFRERLKSMGVPLTGKGTDKKHLTFSDYDAEKVMQAVERARELHKDRKDLCPKYFATTVYLLLEKIQDIRS